MQLSKVSKPMLPENTDFISLLRPETALELVLLETPAFQEGMAWGKPRFGHPEGKVGLHVREVLDNVDRFAKNEHQRSQLRLIAFAHDSFKFKEFQLGRRVKHHGVLAREFMENYIDDPILLNIIELHDEAFYIWRGLAIEHQSPTALQRLDGLLEALGNNLELYFYFFKCDTQTGDKVLAPLFWFEQVVALRLG